MKAKANKLATAGRVSSRVGGTVLFESMQNVFDAVGSHDDAARRQSALGTLAGVAGPLASIPAHGPTVRRFLKVSPAARGLTHRGLAADKKVIGEVLRALGIERMPARYEVPLEPQWKELFAAVPRKPFSIDLVRFARWSSMRDIAPARVQPDDFVQFGEDLLETTRPDLARNVYLRTCATWDRAAATFKDVWPQIRSSYELHYEWYAEPWTSYPASIVVEKDKLFQARLTAGLSSPWRKRISEATARSQSEQLRRYLHAVCQSGSRPEELVSLRVALAPERFDAAINWRLAQNGHTYTRELFDSAVNLRAIARNWLNFGRAELDRFNKIIADLEPVPAPICRKSADLLLMLQDPALTALLRGLGAAILERYSGVARLTKRQALDIECAAAMGILTSTAMGPSHLVALRLDDVVCTPGRATVRRVRSGAPEETDVIELPPVRRAVLNLYLAVARTRLHPEHSEQLFPGAGGASRHPVAYSRCIAAFVEREAGIRITAGQFGYLIGFLYLKEHPGKFGVVATFLGISEKRAKTIFKRFTTAPMRQRRDARIRQGLGRLSTQRWREQS